jgi:hypothetical protein
MTEASKTLYGRALDSRSKRMPERKSAIEILFAILSDEMKMSRETTQDITRAVGRQSLWLFGSIRTRLTPICRDRES